MSDIYGLIGKQLSDMSNVQKKVATYILDHRVEVAFLNVKQLAAEAGVSEASIIRFANFMGFKGYSELQKLLKEHAKQNLDNKDHGNGQTEVTGIEAVFQAELMHIQKTYEELKKESFLHVVEEIIRAKRVFIICGRSTRALGSFLEYYLKIIIDNVYLIESYEGKEELLNSIGSDDLVIGMTFERYTKRTIEMVSYTHRKNARIVAITDYVTSPIIKYADYYLLAETHSSKYLESFVGPQVVINALLTFVAKSKEMILDEKFTNFENICDELQIFI